MEQIYIWDGEIQSGPYSDMMLRAALAVGDVTPDQHYWAEGMAGWEPLAGSPYAPMPGPPPRPAAAVVEAPAAEVVGADMTPALAVAGAAAAMEPAVSAGGLPPGLQKHIASKQAAKAAQAAASPAVMEAERRRSIAIAYAIGAALLVGLLGGLFWMGFVLTTGLRTRLIMLGIGGACGGAVKWAKGTQQKGLVFGVIAAIGLLLGLAVGYYGLWVEYLRMDTAGAAWEAAYDMPNGTEEAADAAAAAAAATVSDFSMTTAGEVGSHWKDYIRLSDVIFGVMAVGAAFLLPIADMAEEEKKKDGKK